MGGGGKPANKRSIMGEYEERLLVGGGDLLLPKNLEAEGGSCKEFRGG
jgi:hypothetical protein